MAVFTRRIALAAAVTGLLAIVLRVATPFGLEIAAGVAGGLYLGYTATRYDAPLFDGVVVGALGAVLYGVLWIATLATTETEGWVFAATTLAVPLYTAPLFATEAIVVTALLQRRRGVQ